MNHLLTLYCIVVWICIIRVKYLIYGFQMLKSMKNNPFHHFITKIQSNHRKSLYGNAQNRLYSTQKSSMKIFMSDSNEEFNASKDVQDVLSIISKRLSKVVPSSGNGNSDVNASGDMKFQEMEIKQEFDRLLKVIQDSNLNELDKKFASLEASSIYKDVSRYGPITQSDMGKIPVTYSKTSIYSDATAPVILVYGTGLVGLKMKSVAESLGKSANIKFINADYLISMKDSELVYTIRDANTVIIAADAITQESKGWFGSSPLPERKYCIDDKVLKRLMNVIMNDQKRRYTETPIKLVWFGSAFKQQKSVASFLGGDTIDMDSEFILQCTQRGFRYLSILTGGVIADDVKYPDNVRKRTSYMSLFDSSDFKDSTYPVLFTSTKSLESTEFTTVSVACEALFRAATHPNGNSTITVLSKPIIGTSSTSSSSSSTSMMSLTKTILDSEWDDEFAKLDGPELLRIKLQYTSTKQVLSRLRRVLPQLALPGSGIVTPIEVTCHTNGIRIIFVPKQVSYESSKEEKQRETDYEKSMTNEMKVKSKYIPPENDKNAFKPLEEKLPMKSSGKVRKPEGGVEVIIEDQPIARVRLRRCNMAPSTIIKEESEALIVKSIINAIKVLENDCRIMTKSEEQQSV